MEPSLYTPPMEYRRIRIVEAGILYFPTQPTYPQGPTASPTILKGRVGIRAPTPIATYPCIAFLRSFRPSFHPSFLLSFLHDLRGVTGPSWRVCILLLGGRLAVGSLVPGGLMFPGLNSCCWVGNQIVGAPIIILF